MKVSLKTTDFYKKFFDKECKIEDFDVLFECETLSCGDVIEHDGKTYSVCSVNNKIGLAIVEPITINGEPETIYCDDELKCPVCGWINIDSWELSDGDDDYPCGQCGSILEYDSFVTRTFTVKVKEICEIKKI